MDYYIAKAAVNAMRNITVLVFVTLYGHYLLSQETGSCCDIHYANVSPFFCWNHGGDRICRNAGPIIPAGTEIL